MQVTDLVRAPSRELVFTVEGGCGVWRRQGRRSRHWLYPNGRQYYTPLPKHMTELVDQIIADATEKGFESTRKRDGRKRVIESTMLEPIVREHDPQYAEKARKCRICKTDTFCFFRLPQD